MSHPNCGFPDCLHGDGDEAGDGVCKGQVKHQEVDVGAASNNLKRFPNFKRFKTYFPFFTLKIFSSDKKF